MDLNVVRVKRKATEEPAEALVIALKKPKCEDKHEQVFLELAATLTHEEDVKEAGIRAALIKDKLQRIQLKQSPKVQHSYSSLAKRAKDLKQQRVEKRQKILDGRRLILAESYAGETNGEKEVVSTEEGADHGLFRLYDIIEEEKDTKHTEGSSDESTGKQSRIMCNGVPLIRVTGPQNKESGEYVYDYYIATGGLDQKFVDSSVSVESYQPAEEMVHENDSDREDYYDDDDDSNDEDNWRNDYPDEDSDFERNRDYYDEYYDEDEEQYALSETFQRFNIDEEKEGPSYAKYKARILKELEGFDDEEGEFGYCEEGDKGDYQGGDIGDYPPDD